jgi:hypothetical protein
MMKKLTIAEMKELNKAKGGHWFDKGAMRFFNTRIETQPNAENIFITSEYMDNPSNKKYSLRWFNTETHDVVTLGDFNAIRSLDKAKELRKEYTKGKKDMGIDY